MLVGASGRARLGLMTVLVCLGSPRPADADADASTESDRRDSRITGQITSSTLVHRETERSEVGAALPGTSIGFGRWVTDLRLRLDAHALAGGAGSARADLRVRRAANVVDDLEADDGEAPLDARAFDRDELEIRELFVSRSIDRFGWGLGRQVVHEVAGTRVDGFRVDLLGSSRWRYAGFAGLHPQRGSRSVDRDYPRQRDPGVEGGEAGLILPVTAGLGGAYALRRGHGAIGLAGIWSRTRDPLTGLADVPRVFVTSNGYWRGLPNLDLYHDAVLDLESSSGTGITSLIVGASYQPVPKARISGQVARYDSETLAVLARNHLEARDDSGADRVQNALALTRVASESARLGASASLARGRYELSATGAVRRRPDTQIETAGGGDYTFPRARSAEVTVTGQDRRSILGTRLGLTVARVFRLGDSPSYAGASSQLVRAVVGYAFGHGAREVQLDASYLRSEDDLEPTPTGCGAFDPMSCYGTGQASTVQLGAVLASRLLRNWHLDASIQVGRQVREAVASVVSGPDRRERITVTGFARLSYRFDR